MTWTNNDLNVCRSLLAKIDEYFAPLSVIDQTRTLTYMTWILFSMLAASEIFGPKRPKKKPWMTFKKHFKTV